MAKSSDNDFLVIVPCDTCPASFLLIMHVFLYPGGCICAMFGVVGRELCSDWLS